MLWELLKAGKVYKKSKLALGKELGKFTRRASLLWELLKAGYIYKKS